MHPITKLVSFMHAISAARQSKVHIRNILTGATVSLEPGVANHTTSGQDNVIQYLNGETAHAAGMLFTALVSTMFGPDTSLQITLNTLTNNVISMSVTIAKEAPADHESTALRI